MKKIIYFLISFSFLNQIIAKSPLLKDLSQKFIKDLEIVGPIQKEVIEWYGDPKAKQPERMFLYAEVSSLVDERLAKNESCEQLVTQLPVSKVNMLPPGMAKKICTLQVFYKKLEKEGLN